MRRAFGRGALATSFTGVCGRAVVSKGMGLKRVDGDAMAVGGYAIDVPRRRPVAAHLQPSESPSFPRFAIRARIADSAGQRPRLWSSPPLCRAGNHIVRRTVEVE